MNQSQNKLNIVYIIPRFHPFKGGAEKNIETMALGMVVAGHTVSVYTTNVRFRNEPLLKFETYKGIDIYRHWAPNEALYAGFYPRLFTRLLTNKIDVIHVSGFGFMWVEFCLVVKKIFDRNVVMINTPHGPFLAFAERGIKKIIKTVYTPLLKVILPFLYDRVIAVVPKQHEWMTTEYRIKKEKIIVIPNGIPAHYISKQIPEYNKNDKMIITYLNRMEWYKGIHDVLYALAKMPQNLLEKMEFWIMGREGNYTPKLKEIVEKHNLQKYVKFIFTPTDEERDEAFLKSQVNILPSKWEATGITLLEAMAKGNVIVTTYQNEAVDMIITEQSGFAYNFGDVTALQSILETLVTEYAKRQKMIQHNLSFVRQFTWEEIVPKYVAAVEKLGIRREKTSNS